MTLIIKRPGIEEFFALGGHYTKMLILGIGGSGKTPFASFAPKPIFASCGPGLASVSDATDRMEYAKIKSAADMKELLKVAKMECLKGEKRRWQTFVVDCLDDYQSEVLMQQWQRQNSTESFTGNLAWNWLGTHMGNLISDLNTLPMHVIVLMHPKTLSDDEEKDDIAFRPRLKGDIKDTILNDFDLVGHMEAGWKKQEGSDERVRFRRIRWWPEPRMPFLRDRFHALPQFTDVNFQSDDFIRIHDEIQRVAQERDLKVGEVTDELTTEDDTKPVSTATGGPVRLDPKAAAPARRTPARKAVAAADGPRTEKPDMVVVEVKEGADSETAVDPESEKVIDLGNAPEVTGTDVDAFGPDEVVDLGHDAAVDAVTEVLGGTVVSDSGLADGQGGRQVVCGDQPEQFAGKHRPEDGCGKVIMDGGVVVTGEKKMPIEIALLKTRTYLCNACWTAFKTAQS